MLNAVTLAPHCLPEGRGAVRVSISTTVGETLTALDLLGKSYGARVGRGGASTTDGNHDLRSARSSFRMTLQRGKYVF